MLVPWLETKYDKTNTLYGAEAWALLSNDATALRIFERKVLRKILCPMRFGDDFRIRFNSDLIMTLFNVLIFRGCAGHVVRKKADTPMIRVFDAVIRRRGRPCIRWKDKIEAAMPSIGVTNWRMCATSRDAWKDIMWQPEIH